ncbi:hypothetical protein [Actinoplanes sp. M2I2]|uniref:hypothetical protein n=1 Tax=Actinoplanes sp. M2I2 TaxID=1734444 RepID=UPI0020207C04|nr:hypothetical protein [Actinoplanes sp. M2I2]
MEPVPVTRKVRRIVRMAVALVIGQAMLCALIGWLTFGRGASEPVRSPGSSVVDQLAAPPLTEPARPSPRAAIVATTRAREPVPASARPASRRSTAATVAPSPPATTVTTPATTAPTPATTAPTTPATQEPVSLVPPAAPELDTPAPSPSAVSPSLSPTSATPSPGASSALVRQPVRAGDECRPVGAYGRTAKGEPVRCVREWGHRPRWKIV